MKYQLILRVLYIISFVFFLFNKYWKFLNYQKKKKPTLHFFEMNIITNLEIKSRKKM